MRTTSKASQKVKAKDPQVAERGGAGCFQDSQEVSVKGLSGSVVSSLVGQQLLIDGLAEWWGLQVTQMD